MLWSVGKVNAVLHCTVVLEENCFNNGGSFLFSDLRSRDVLS